MGRRSRSRTPGGPPRHAERRARAADGLSPSRRTLAIYLGIALLGGTGGPLIVFAYVVLAAGLTQRWAMQRLAGATMTDEDRMMQTMAGGLLAISVALAAISAVVLALS